MSEALVFDTYRKFKVLLNLLALYDTVEDGFTMYVSKKWKSAVC